MHKNYLKYTNNSIECLLFLFIIVSSQSFDTPHVRTTSNFIFEKAIFFERNCNANNISESISCETWCTMIIYHPIYPYRYGLILKPRQIKLFI